MLLGSFLGIGTSFAVFLQLHVALKPFCRAKRYHRQDCLLDNYQDSIYISQIKAEFSVKSFFELGGLHATSYGSQRLFFAGNQTMSANEQQGP